MNEMSFLIRKPVRMSKEDRLGMSVFWKKLSARDATDTSTQATGWPSVTSIPRASSASRAPSKMTI